METRGVVENTFHLVFIFTKYGFEMSTSFDGICPSCGRPHDEPIDERNGYPWVLVYTTEKIIDAEMYRAYLEGASIPVNILSQVDSAYSLSVGDLAVVKIYVLSPFAAEAREIIDSINRDIEQDSNPGVD